MRAFAMTVVNLSTATAARRFIGWRTYHQLAERLGREPFASEIAAECGMSEQAVWAVSRTLRTCSPRRVPITEVTTYDTGNTSSPTGHRCMLSLVPFSDDDEPMDVYDFVTRDVA